MVSSASQIPYVGWHNIRHRSLPELLFNNTPFPRSGQTNSKYLFCNIGLRLIPPPLKVALHKFPIAAGTICATLFCHGRYLTTLLSCPQVKQTKKSLFSIFRPTTKLHLQPTKRHKKEKTVYNNPKQD
jgi:hypothetical protein